MKNISIGNGSNHHDHYIHQTKTLESLKLNTNDLMFDSNF